MGKMSYKKCQFGECAPAIIPDFIDYYVSDYGLQFSCFLISCEKQEIQSLFLQETRKKQEIILLHVLL